MSNNKNYIKLKYTDYGYEIYAITGTKIIKLSKKDKIIMHKILKNFQYIKMSDNTLIYPNYNLITLYFSKEKLNSRPPKVKRIKSRQIISGFLLLVTLAGVNGIVNTIDEPETELYSQIAFEAQALENAKIGEDVIIIDDMLPDSYEQNLDEYIDVSHEIEQQELENINEFYYECENPNDKAALINSEEYMEVFKKYEEIYGVDAKLLCAIGAQESSGIHHQSSINGGYSTGLMGIEYIWANGQIKVFNFEKNEYETITVDYSRIGELDYNIKIGAAIFQNYFYNTLKNNTSLGETEYLAFTLQKYNMGPGNMRKILKYGDNWMDNRDMINAGDKYYIEHVLSRFDNDTVIRIRLDDGSYFETKFINTALENKYSRT